MRKTTKILSWALPLLFLVPTASAQVSNCSRALGEAYLDINNVRARILNGGGLFYRGEPHVYEVPKGSGSNAIFASGIWLAGEVGGQLRAAATRYGEWEFWAGPLDENGAAPVDCSKFDRVYKVSRDEVGDYEAGQGAAPDLRDWPTGLGAPTLDADGNLIDILGQPLSARVDRKIDLAAGERPAILGDQTIWWVMNDRGNTHASTDAPPIGVEVHGTAFAFNTAGAIGDATFYKYNIFYRGSVPLQNAYMAIFSDPDLGNFDDDYIGSDTTLGLGFVYNSDNDDEGGEGYGSPPPAAGYDFFQGPVVPGAPTDTAHARGQRFPGFKNLAMTSFTYYNNGGCATCDPVSGLDYYNYMRGRWKDGQQFTLGADGRDANAPPVSFAYPGDPATSSFWSETNYDGNGNSVDPGDRRFVMSTGPFTINPGDQQEIVFGVIFAKGADNLDSVSELRKADALAQAAFDVDFQLPQPPDAPKVKVTELDGQVILEWSNPARSNNYLESYSEADPFAPDENKNYDFEGYTIYQYADVADQVGSIIATYDVKNGVTRVIDGPPGDVQTVTAFGSDRGVQRYHSVGALTNYKEYHFGVQAYAYNEPSFPKVYRGPITRVTVLPSRTRDILSEDAIAAANNGTATADLQATFVGAGEGAAWADVINPAAVTGDVYTVEFYNLESGETTYDVVRHAADGNMVVFNGSETGEPAPQREGVVVVDGLQMSITGPTEITVKGFMATANAAGPLDPPDMAAYAFNSSGFPMLEANGLIPEGSHPDPDRPTRGYQQVSGAAWGFHTGGNRTSWDQFLDRTWLGRGNTIAEGLGSSDIEVRFTDACVSQPGSCQGWRRFEDNALMNIPFEVWNVGPTADPSDDFRLLPAILDNGGEVWHKSTPTDTVYTDIDTFDTGGDHPISGGANDPYTDWVYVYEPNDTSPGQAGYDSFIADGLGNGSEMLGHEVWGRMVLVNWNGWSDADGDGQYDTIDAELPEVGTVFKIVTTKPSQPGDVFTFDTAGLGAMERDAAAERAALDEIGITPNPYKGASSYERSQLIDEVRFTNMPEEATIRIFTLNGTLIRTLYKTGPARELRWDLTTENALPIASGIYLIHVDVPNVGEKVLKFAAVKKRIQLNTF